MNFKEYEEAVSRTANTDLSYREKACNWALGIAGEAGEVTEVLKKYLFHEKPMDLNELQKELGDVLYYVQAMCNLFGLNLADCMQVNADKLAKRYPNGFVSGGGIR